MSLASSAARPPAQGMTACLVLADGSVYWGHGIGAEGWAVGELCFNTAMTGYQEILTDNSYAGQIIAFTFPHIGNVGANDEDMEAKEAAARGLVLRQPISDPSNYRATRHLNAWLIGQNLIGITGVDTRHLTRKIRLEGAPNAVVCHSRTGTFDIDALLAEARKWPGLEGMDLAKDVTTRQRHEWDETLWQWKTGYGRQDHPTKHIVAIDYGMKRNILRHLATRGARVTVVPAAVTSEEVKALSPDGIFLSNGPGDPAATGAYAVPVLRDLLASGTPIFGICLGHQLLGLAAGARTSKMHQGHRGANHPVKNLETGTVEITSMNHGFTVDIESLPQDVVPTHISLFDGSLCGLKFTKKPVFSVQYHPEASPGPQDSSYLFDRFMNMVEKNA